MKSASGGTVFGVAGYRQLGFATTRRVLGTLQLQRP
jgi:hypothetical protein